MGSVQESVRGDSVVQEDFELICFDIVSEPSTPEAYIYPNSIKASVSMYESKINENKDNIINNLFDKILKD
jgi:hypothetical protein